MIQEKELLKSQKIKRVEVATQGLTEAGSYFHLKARGTERAGVTGATVEEAVTPPVSVLDKERKKYSASSFLLPSILLIAPSIG